MRLRPTDAERALQDEVRAFLAQDRLHPGDLPHALDDRIAVLREWQAACYAAGYVGRAWPSEFGGGGRPPVEQIVVDQELAAAGAPEFVNIVGLDVLGPSLLRFGNDEQRRRYIPSILSADEIWCQGFSEPEAGSDLASLRTRAREHGRRLRAQRPEDVGLVGPVRALVRRARPHRARTARAHRGISMLIVDMRSPGVEVRPMTQITGHAEFSELFLDDVVVPKENLLGAARRRLEDRHAHARPRARHGRAAAPGQAAHVARPRRARRRRARGRRPAAARRPGDAGRARARARSASRCCATTPTGRSASS